MNVLLSSLALSPWLNKLFTLPALPGRVRITYGKFSLAVSKLVFHMSTLMISNTGSFKSGACCACGVDAYCARCVRLSATHGAGAAECRPGDRRGGHK